MMSRALPAPLKPGACIGVLSPSGPLRPPAFDKGCAWLRERGFRVKIADHAFDRRGYLAGMDGDRAEDFTAMFLDPEVDAVWCSRGGYGSVRIIDRVDWEAVASHPKQFIGYSDITSLHLALAKHAGIVTYYGPVVETFSGEFCTEAEQNLWAVLQGEPDPPFHLPQNAVSALVPGTARGRLEGGCISILAAALGTPEAPNFSGAIVLLEDIGEPNYRTDRYLAQLVRSGSLDDCAGIVVGTVTHAERCTGKVPSLTLHEIWRDWLCPLKRPVMLGFPFGHEPNPLTLPLGLPAEMDAARGLTLI
jgi:muramoyltetrapeptide carboxypeptidase